MKMSSFETNLSVLKAARDHEGADKFFTNLPVLGPIAKKLRGRLGTMTDEELADVAAEATNNQHSGIDWAKVGSAPGVLRKLFILTEGFTRSQLGLATRAVQPNAEGFMARRILLSEVANAAILSTGISLLLSGRLPEYDPRSDSWLDVQSPTGPTSILPHKQILKTITQILGGRKPGEYGSDLPAAQQRWDALWSFGEGRVGQLPGIAGEQISGREFGGRRIVSSPDTEIQDRLLSALRGFAPIIVSSVEKELFEAQSLPSVLVRRAEEFLGFNARPYPKTRPGGQDIPGLQIYWDRFQIVADSLIAETPDLAEPLTEYSRLSRIASQLLMNEGIKAAEETNRRREALGNLIKSQFGEDVIVKYNRGVRQMHDGIVADYPDVKAYLETRRNKPFAAPTPTPSSTPTPLPPQPTSTKSPSYAPGRPSPGPTQRARGTVPEKTVGRVQDEVAEFASVLWNRYNPDGTPLSYEQFAPYERKALDEWLNRLNAESQRVYKKDWRALTDAQQRAVARGVPPPDRPIPTPTRTRTPTKTPTPNIYDEYRRRQTATPYPTSAIQPLFP